MTLGLEALQAEVAAIKPVKRVGRVIAIEGGCVLVSGLCDIAALGDMVKIVRKNNEFVLAEVSQLKPDCVVLFPDGRLDGVQVGDRIVHLGRDLIWPDVNWLGRVIDPYGNALDGLPLLRGGEGLSLQGEPINPAQRRGLGQRLQTGLSVLNTVLPIVRGQRVGLFAGSGVGKSTLLGKLARGLQADVVVIALVGERGREVREFVEKIIGPTGMARAVVVAATSDRSAITRRRCARAATTIAEYFRDQGNHVVLVLDSVTRFAQAHREIALASGEPGTLGGFPPSVSQEISQLCERSGPGTEFSGDITAIFSVLVAGSDMEEPVADMLRGFLDGHIVLDRSIAERGRFPAIDVLRSVSRSLPEAAENHENDLISRTRQTLSVYEQNEMMIRASLYSSGSNEMIDEAIDVWPRLDDFFGSSEAGNIEHSFQKLANCFQPDDETVERAD